MSKLNFKLNDCFLCEDDNSSPTIYTKNAFDNEFKILNCNVCDSNYINKVPSDEYTYNYIYDFGGIDSKIEIKNILTRLRILKATYYLKKNCPEILVNNLDVLDYGSGDGYLSYSINQLNENTNVFASDYIKKDSPFYKNVTFNSLDEIMSLDRKYDIIILRHVLEHIEEPKKVIDELIYKLKNGGYILVEVPNHELKTNIMLRIFKKDYNQIGLPWHFNHFNVSIFDKMFKDHKLVYSENSIPVLGQSLMMKFNKQYLTFDGTGFIALLFYPIQYILDLISKSHTAIILKIYKETIK